MAEFELAASYTERPVPVPGYDAPFDRLEGSATIFVPLTNELNRMLRTQPDIETTIGRLVLGYRQPTFPTA